MTKFKERLEWAKAQTVRTLAEQLRSESSYRESKKDVLNAELDEMYMGALKAKLRLLPSHWLIPNFTIPILRLSLQAEYLLHSLPQTDFGLSAQISLKLTSRLTATFSMLRSQPSTQAHSVRLRRGILTLTPKTLSMSRRSRAVRLEVLPTIM
jgi:hypothetical protein